MNRRALLELLVRNFFWCRGSASVSCVPQVDVGEGALSTCVDVVWRGSCLLRAVDEGQRVNVLLTMISWSC
jgi:hypothetical protein